jgi:hypothetical protein
MRTPPMPRACFGLLCGLSVLSVGCGSPSSQTLDSLTVSNAFFSSSWWRSSSEGRSLRCNTGSWKTVEVALDVKGNSSASRELSFAHFSTIRTIDVNSVTYADGSTWHASSAGACSVAPSLMMRISAQ